MKNRPLIKALDLILILIVLLFAVAFFAFKTSSSQNLVLCIYRYGDLTQEVRLDELNGVTTFEAGNVIVEADCDYAAVKSSDCRGKECVRAGKLTKSGDTAVCAPNGVVVTLQGEESRYQTY